MHTMKCVCKCHMEQLLQLYWHVERFVWISICSCTHVCVWREFQGFMVYT